MNLFVNYSLEDLQQKCGTQENLVSLEKKMAVSNESS